MAGTIATVHIVKQLIFSYTLCHVCVLVIFSYRINLNIIYFGCGIVQLQVSCYGLGVIFSILAGDLLGFGCRGHGQLLVWEWKSESYVLKQQGHSYNMNCVSYSPDSLSVATGT